MRAWLVACAALALAHAAAPVATPPPVSHYPLPLSPHTHTLPHSHHTHARPPRLDPARLDHIKSQILAKLGLSERPTPLGAPPRDVVRQILARAADPHPPPQATQQDSSMREIIAIAHREKRRIFLGPQSNYKFKGNPWTPAEKKWMVNNGYQSYGGNDYAD